MDLSLSRKKQKYIFFSGKGGVGKTTLSAAKALDLSEQDNKVLVVSTDPAHSLSDSFGQDIKSEITKIRENLHAIEIDPKKAMDEYQEKMESSEMEGMDMLGGFGLDELNMASNSPGMNEFAAFDKFLQCMDEDKFDYIIFDTAPTGHTLKFLSLPDIMEGWVGKMLMIKSKFSQMSNMFKGFMPFGESEEKEQVDLTPLQDLKDKIEEAREIMTDQQRTEFNLVTIPEKMSIEETDRTIDKLKDNDMEVSTIIVNKIIPEQSGCDFCKARRRMQIKNLEELRERFENYELVEIPLLKEEIVGINRLSELNNEKSLIKESIEEVQAPVK